MSNDRPTAASVPLPKSKRGLKGFWRETVRELKHVHWPTTKETNRLTGVVMGVCVLTVGVLFGLSVVFDQLFKLLIRGNL